MVMAWLLVEAAAEAERVIIMEPVEDVTIVLISIAIGWWIERGDSSEEPYNGVEKVSRK